MLRFVTEPSLLLLNGFHNRLTKRLCVFFLYEYFSIGVHFFRVRIVLLVFMKYNRRRGL